MWLSVLHTHKVSNSHWCTQMHTFIPSCAYVIWISFKEILSTVFLKHAESSLCKSNSVCMHTCFRRMSSNCWKALFMVLRRKRKGICLKASTPSQLCNQRHTLSHTHPVGSPERRSIRTHTHTKKKNAAQAHVSWCNLWAGSWADFSEGSSSRCIALGALRNPPSDCRVLSHTLTHKQCSTKSPLWAVNSSDRNSLHD